jgi:PKD repeat protein
MQIRPIRPAMLVAIIISTAIYGVSSITPAHAAGPLTASFTINPQFALAGGNDSFTSIASGGTTPYQYAWDFGDGTIGGNFSSITHIYKLAGSYIVKLTLRDSFPTTVTSMQTIAVQGSPLTIDGWLVNWNITTNWGIRVSNITYNGVPVIRDAFINGILVRYWPSPPGQPSACLFFDNLGSDDLTARPGGLSLQYSSDPTDPWFQIRTQFQPGYNYTELWRFHQDGQWDSILYVGHLGCGWNHSYQPHFRIDLAVGDKNRDVMGQYTPSGVWRNLIWEGNYTDNASRDPAHNMTEWRLGDGPSYYYFVPTVSPWAPEMPRVAPKIYLVRDRANEVEENPFNDIPVGYIPDPITFANGELAYRQSVAFWYLPTYWDHWTGLTFPVYAPPSMVSLSFYPSGI